MAVIWLFNDIYSLYGVDEMENICICLILQKLNRIFGPCFIMIFSVQDDNWLKH